MNWRKSILIHVPHSSTFIPDVYRTSFLLSDEELKHEVLLMTDHFVDDLFAIPGITSHINPISRLVMDPERFRSDADEPMVKKGMGAVYTRTATGKLMRDLSQSEHVEILTNLYDPYHAGLAQKTARILAEHNLCLIIDAHSYPSEPLPYEQHDDGEQPNRPDICLGYEPYHMDDGLLAKAVDYFENRCGLTTAHNEPFAGSMVPSCYYHRDPRVRSLMIEIKRSLYMDERTAEQNHRYGLIKKRIHNFFTHVIG